MGFLSLSLLISSSQVKDGPQAPANRKAEERMGSRNTLTIYELAFGANGKAVEVTVQQSHLQSLSQKSLEPWVFPHLGQPEKPKSR